MKLIWQQGRYGMIVGHVLMFGREVGVLTIHRSTSRLVPGWMIDTNLTGVPQHVRSQGGEQSKFESADEAKQEAEKIFAQWKKEVSR